MTRSAFAIAVPNYDPHLFKSDDRSDGGNCTGYVDQRRRHLHEDRRKVGGSGGGGRRRGRCESSTLLGHAGKALI